MVPCLDASMMTSSGFARHYVHEAVSLRCWRRDQKVEHREILEGIAAGLALRSLESDGSAWCVSPYLSQCSYARRMASSACCAGNGIGTTDGWTGRTNERTDRRTDRRTDEQTDKRTGRRTDGGYGHRDGCYDRRDGPNGHRDGHYSRRDGRNGHRGGPNGSDRSEL